MNSDERNESLMRQLRSTLATNFGPNTDLTRYYGTLAAAGAALLGGALYYYLSSSSSSSNSIKAVVDHKNQTREVQVIFKNKTIVELDFYFMI